MRLHQLYFGKGKAKALKLARSSEHFLHAFSELGSTEVAGDKTVHTLDKFTCTLYGDLAAQTVNGTLYNLFTHGKFGDCLPPNNDALILHVNHWLWFTIC